MTETDKKLDATVKEFNCETGTLHRADDGLLHLVSHVGIPDFLIEKISHIPFGKGIAGVAAESRRPVELCNLQEDLEGVAKKDARKTGVSGSLAVPILSPTNGEVIGTLGVGKAASYEFTDEEKARLSELGEACIDILMSAE